MKNDLYRLFIEKINCPTTYEWQKKDCGAIYLQLFLLLIITNISTIGYH
jgi:hypothetical protein